MGLIFFVWFRVSGPGFWVPGSGFRDSSLGFQVSGLGFQVPRPTCAASPPPPCVLLSPVFGFRVLGFESQVSGLGFRVKGFESRVSGLVFRVSGIGFRMPAIGVTCGSVCALGYARPGEATLSSWRHISQKYNFSTKITTHVKLPATSQSKCAVIFFANRIENPRNRISGDYLPR